MQFGQYRLPWVWLEVFSTWRKIGTSIGQPIKRVVWSISLRRFYCISIVYQLISVGYRQERFRNGLMVKISLIFNCKIIDRQIDRHHCGQIDSKQVRFFGAIPELRIPSRDGCPTVFELWFEFSNSYRY